MIKTLEMEGQVKHIALWETGCYVVLYNIDKCSILYIQKNVFIHTTLCNNSNSVIICYSKHGLFLDHITQS